MLYLRVRNWEKYQHYKDRGPSWIKLYPKLQELWEFTTLDDAAKAHLLGIFMLAARLGNRIPADPRYVGQQIGATSPVDLDLLRDRQFLVFEEGEGKVASADVSDPEQSAGESVAGPAHDASGPLAEPERTASGSLARREQVAPPHKRTENREQKPTPYPPPTGGGTLSRHESGLAADRIAARASALDLDPWPDQAVRGLARRLRRGQTSEPAEIAALEAAAVARRAERVAAEDDAAANAWFDRHGGWKIVARAASMWLSENRRAGESEADALARWGATGETLVPAAVVARLSPLIRIVDQWAARESTREPERLAAPSGPRRIEGAA